MKVGDIVTLCGQAQLMTVEKMSGDRITCVWFDRLDRVNSWTFPAADLEAEPSLQTA